MGKKMERKTKENNDKKDQPKKTVQFVKGHSHGADYLQHRHYKTRPMGKTGAAQMLRTHEYFYLHIQL